MTIIERYEVELNVQRFRRRLSGLDCRASASVTVVPQVWDDDEATDTLWRKKVGWRGVVGGGGGATLLRQPGGMQCGRRRRRQRTHSAVWPVLIMRRRRLRRVKSASRLAVLLTSRRTHACRN